MFSFDSRFAHCISFQVECFPPKVCLSLIYSAVVSVFPDKMKGTEKGSDHHIEIVGEDLYEQEKLGDAVKVMGTVKLTEDSIVYIPTPTADPRGMQ